MKIATLLFIAFVSISSYGFTQTVTIGTQTWMTKNLDVATFRNGDVIPQAKTDEEWQAAGENKSPAWCYYDNDPKNGTKYGKLYNWYAVNDARGLAPTGFHIPSPQEWHVLSTFLGGYDVVDKKMKSNSGWLNSNGTNSSGFSGLPGGCRYYDGYFDNVGMGGYWWSSDMVQNGPYICGSELVWLHQLRSRGTTQSPSFSARCVKN
jgi:uncharacterized protein (TIGR02145 family)